jgi:hypothetical protein
MSLSAVDFQHRLPLLKRHVGKLVQMMKLRLPDGSEDLTDLGRHWQVDVDEVFVAGLRGDRLCFEKREHHVSKRWGA